MFAAASDRAAVIDLLASRGADIKATTNTIDLNAAGRANAAFAGVLFGNPAPPPAAPGAQPAEGGRGGRGGGRAGAAPTETRGGPEVPAVPAAQQQGRFNPGAQGKAGIDRQ